jgi:hypothetical protein
MPKPPHSVHRPRRLFGVLCALALAIGGFGWNAAPVFGAASAGDRSAAAATPATASPSRLNTGRLITSRLKTNRLLTNRLSSSRANASRALLTLVAKAGGAEVFVAAPRRGSDTAPVGTATAPLVVPVALLPAGRALTGTPSRAPPASRGLPDTRAPPTSGRF